MRTVVAAMLIALLTAPLAGAQDRTASERYANAIRKASGLSPATVRTVEQTVEKGWPSGSAAETLTVLLRVNAASLAEIRRGAALPTCVLYPGRNVFDRSLDDVAVLAVLTRLCGVHGLRALRQGDEAQAARDVATMLGVGRHLAADRAMAVRLLGLSLVRQGCAIGLRLRGRPARATLSEALRGYTLPALAEMLLAEKDVFLDAVEFTSREVARLRPQMVALAPAVAAAYYDPAIIAFTSGGPAERKAADDKVRALRQQLKKTYRDLTITRILEQGQAQKTSDAALAEELCRAVLCGVWPDFGAFARAFHDAQAALDELRKRT